MTENGSSEKMDKEQWSASYTSRTLKRRLFHGLNALSVIDYSRAKCYLFVIVQTGRLKTVCYIQ